MVDPVGTMGVTGGLYVFALCLLALGLTLMSRRKR